MRELIMPCTDSSSIALSTRAVALFGPNQAQAPGRGRILEILALTVGHEGTLHPFVWSCEGAKSAKCHALLWLKAKLQKA